MFLSILVSPNPFSIWIYPGRDVVDNFVQNYFATPTPFWKGTYSKRKNLLPLSFYSKPLLQKGLGVQESMQEVTKVDSPVKIAHEIYQVYPIPLIWVGKGEKYPTTWALGEDSGQHANPHSLIRLRWALSWQPVSADWPESHLSYGTFSYVVAHSFLFLNQVLS